MSKIPTPPLEALVVYHGTSIESLGSILRDGYIKPHITNLKPSTDSTVHLSFSFTKAQNYGDVVFEIPYIRLSGNICVCANWNELTTDAPVEIHLRDIMIFDDEKKYKELA